MHKVQRVSSLRAAVTAARKDKKIVGFVPTMGNLHEGHLELVKLAMRQADFVIVSIYVNPTQFGANEDLDNYPSTPEEDARLLAECGADLLFLPSQETMYPGDLKQQTVVYVPEIGDKFCGVDRPEHFYGVTTVVSRLFNMVQPDVAVFGKKDYQQIAIIKKMVEDLAYPIEIVGVDTVRSEQGLALSSRNGYLTKKQLELAPQLYAQLLEISEKLQSLSEQGKVITKTVFSKIESEAFAKLAHMGFQPQYLNICVQHDLSPAKKGDRALVVLVAAVLGKTRLIDNLEINL